MDEGYVFFRAGCIAAVLIIASFAGCTAHQNYVDDAATVELVAKGANALEAWCAIRGSGENARCAILASRKP